MAERFIIDTSGGTGGGGIGDIDFSLAAIQSSSGWIVYDTHIGNSGSLPVTVTSSLTVKQYNSSEDIFKVQNTNASTNYFLIDNNGIPIMSVRNSFPTVKEGGMIYKSNEFYFGYS